MKAIKTINKEIHRLQQEQAKLVTDDGVVYPYQSIRFNALMKQIRDLVSCKEYLKNQEVI